MRSYEMVFREIRRGRYRLTGRLSERGYGTWYDIGLTRREIASSTGVSGRHLNLVLQTLIDRGRIIYRASQKRYVAAGKYKNPIR